VTRRRMECTQIIDKVSKLKLLSDLLVKEIQEKNKRKLKRKNALTVRSTLASELLPKKKKKKLMGRREKEMNLYVDYVKEKTSVFNL